jgi:hypothetical protein
MKNLSQDSQCPGNDENWASVEHNSTSATAWANLLGKISLVLLRSRNISECSQMHWIGRTFEMHTLNHDFIDYAHYQKTKWNSFGKGREPTAATAA